MRRWLERLTRSREADEAEVLVAHLADEGAEPIETCRRGERVRVCGTVRSLSLRPRSTAPALEAEIYDGTGHLTVVWLGRRRIPGVDVGTTMVVEGRLTCPNGEMRIYNPDYVLRPRVGA